MDWIQFFIVVALLLWIVWRSPPRIAQYVLMRRLFEQLNQIESTLSGVSAEAIEQKWVDYQAAKIAANKGAPWSVRIRG
jgi:hypothetical protein